jgi:hypothetical protein
VSIDAARGPAPIRSRAGHRIAPALPADSRGLASAVDKREFEGVQVRPVAVLAEFDGVA